MNKIQTALLAVATFALSAAVLSAQNTRWSLPGSGEGIIWDVANCPEESLPHEDHIEMSGESVSCVLRWGVSSDRSFHCEKSLVFPLLRTVPNNTSASLYLRSGADIPSLILVNGRSLVGEKVQSIRIDAGVEVESLWAKSVRNIGVGKNSSVPEACVNLRRYVFPSTTLPAVYERFTIRNVSNENLYVCVPEFESKLSTDPSAGVDGAYILKISVDGAFSASISPEQERNFTVIYQAFRKGGEVFSPLLAGSEPVERTVSPESPLCPDVEKEYEKRLSFVSALDSSLVFESPDSILNSMFRFAKIRACESIYRTKGGLMHGPGGERYYAAIWANDQAEYINPLFPFIGYELGNESALNSFRLFAGFMNDDYSPIPSSIIAEGDDIWNRKGDRGDAAMIAYGAARYALARGDSAKARELWPLIEWCLEYCRRHINSEGVVESDTDELENRFESGDANLCTSTLYYDALLSASYLGKEIGVKSSVIKDYRRRAEEMANNIEKYFGAEVSGYRTYRYYDGNTLLRSWICMPLIAGITTRAEATAAALTGPELMTENGCLTEQGSSVFWDRSTLYAFRGLFYSGADTRTALSLLHSYSSRRLLGDHVPYAVEAWPEGSQRHLSAESGLYCRVITEGLFGIRPRGLDSFSLRPRLPEGWPSMALRHIKAFGADFDIVCKRLPSGKVETSIITHSKTKPKFFIEKTE